MDLVQNLKKTLSNTVNKILVVLLSRYIKLRAKQTLKRPDNSLEITSSQSPLTTEPQPTTIVTSSVDTTEKTTMVEPTTEEIVKHVHDWAIERITDLMDTSGDKDNIKSAIAISAEFQEWFEEPEDPSDEIDIMCIEEYE